MENPIQLCFNSLSLLLIHFKSSKQKLCLSMNPPINFEKTFRSTYLKVLVYFLYFPLLKQTYIILSFTKLLKLFLLSFVRELMNNDPFLSSFSLIYHIVFLLIFFFKKRENLNISELLIVSIYISVFNCNICQLAKKLFSFFFLYLIQWKMER